MSADDPRHGSVAGYNRIPCREECCRRAMANYKSRWELDRIQGRGRIVSTLGTRRRIQALNALGWSNHEIAQRLGNDRSNLTRLIYGETMTRGLAERVAKVYDELSMCLPTGNRQAIINVRNRARKNGWPPPLAWDDEAIDDPNATPPQLPGVSTRRQRLEDIEWLADNDETLTGACQRLGIKADSLRAACKRAGRMDLFDRLANREPNAGIRIDMRAMKRGAA